jgi:hypothetical protein
MRTRREFDAQYEFETSTALTVHLDRKISDWSGYPCSAKHRRKAPSRTNTTG